MSARCPHCNELIEIRQRSKGGKDNPIDIDEVLALHRFGAKPKEIAELYGVTRSRISNIIHTKRTDR